MAFKTFISHITLQEEFRLINPILQRAAQHGIQCYLAEFDTRAGTDLRTKLHQEILSSNCVLVLLTPRSINSDLVRWEVGVADALQKTVIFVIENGIKIPGYVFGREYILVDPHNPAETTRAVSDYLHTLKLDRDKSTAIFWTIIGTVGALWAISSSSDEERV